MKTTNRRTFLKQTATASVVIAGLSVPSSAAERWASKATAPVKVLLVSANTSLGPNQSRSDASGFQHNGEAGKLIHGLLGWDKLIPESMAMYQAGRPTFRLASKPEAEARLWMLDGIASGLQPWWHHVSAYHEDRRMSRTAEPIYNWHRENEQFLTHRLPLATIGVVWSQQNTDFFGRDEAEALVELPWRAVTQALIRARIPYLPVHADHIDRNQEQFAALVLPNVGALSDFQVAAIRRFVRRGGGVLATGETSLFNQWGDPRPDFALADLFGAHMSELPHAADEARRKKYANDTAHTYLRLSPELRAKVAVSSQTEGYTS